VATELVRATLADLELIRTLAARIWRVHYPGIISPAQIEHMLGTMYAAEVLARELVDPRQAYELLRVDGEAVGYLAWRHEPESRALKLAKLYLEPALHGRGLGARMLARTDELARSLRSVRIYLFVNQRNHLAIRAYQRAGYAIEAAETGDAGGGYVMEDWRMAKSLAGIPRSSG
jgi:GNAT superfamily N-acetyltransferase